MRRTEARELFMQMLFQMEAQNDYSEQMKQTFIAANKDYYKPNDYFDAMYKVTTTHLTEIDHCIESCSSNWKMNRIAKVDLAILRLSTAEILFMEDVPDSVSINEAVDLAKKFGSEDSGRFVNGVLGKVAIGKDEA